MAMTGSGMGAQIKADIVGTNGAPSNDAELTAYCNALGNAIVSYIQGSAVVEPGSLTSPSGPVTGTGTVE